MDGAVAITGLGAICACGPDVPSLWRALRDGAAGLRTFPDASGARPTALPSVRAPFVVGAVPDAWLPPAADRVVAMALRAAAEAWGDRGAEPRAAVVVGTSAGPLSTEPLTEAEERADPVGATGRKDAARHLAIAAAIAERLGLGGPRLTASTACSSGNAALAVARDLLLAGDADVVLVGGVDGLSDRRYAGFEALGALADGPCAPFSEPIGLNLGEGAAFLVLEHARTAGERTLALLLGVGSAADAVHPTAPDPSGGGTARSLRLALADADVAAAEVGWYAAHATGTALNDAAEWAAVTDVLGRDARLSATKSFFGHPFGACGPLQAIAAVQAIREGEVPPTLRFAGPRPGGPVDPVAHRPRAAAVDVVLSHNAGFGGANHSVVVGRPGRPVAGRGARPVFVHGTSLGRLVGVLERGEAVPSGPIAPPVPRRLDLRRLDPLSVWWTSAAAAALGGGPLRGVASDRCGQVGGTSFRPVTASTAFRTSWETRGPRGVSSAAFSRLVLNAPLGDAAQALGLRGPVEQLATGVGAGLVAIVRAARWVARHPGVDRMIAGGMDERDPSRVADERLGEGAVAVVVGAEGGPVRVAAAALAGSIGEARARVAEAGVPDRVFDAAAVARILGLADATIGAAALAWAAEVVRAGSVRRALVVAHDPGSVAAAIVLEAA